jgi:redox-sensing transcriptional repressor
MAVMTKQKTISKASAKRFPLYLRYLKLLKEDGVKKIQSHAFAELTQIPSTTIRRDFSFLGDLGRGGYGYDVDCLIKAFSEFLSDNESQNIAVIGFGNLGRALLNNNFRRNENICIKAVFDKDPKLTGIEVEGLKVYGMDEFEKIAKQEKISLVISTVPSKYAQEAMDVITSAGVKAILNFAPDRVSVPDDVVIQYIDLTTEVQTLLFYEKSMRNK